MVIYSQSTLPSNREEGDLKLQVLHHYCHSKSSGQAFTADGDDNVASAFLISETTNQEDKTSKLDPIKGDTAILH